MTISRERARAALARPVYPVGAQSQLQTVCLCGAIAASRGVTDQPAGLIGKLDGPPLDDDT